MGEVYQISNAGVYQFTYAGDTGALGYEFTVPKPTDYVRVYALDSKGRGMIGHWMMLARDIKDLGPEQIASKFSLPQVPTHKADVEIPAHTKMRATVANDINIFPEKSIGGNGGGGGVQFELLDIPKKENDFINWFSNPRRIQ